MSTARPRIASSTRARVALPGSLRDQSAAVAVAARSRPTASSRSRPARSRSARASSPRWRRSSPTSSTSSSRACAWSRRRTATQPQRGRHLGQPVGAGLRPRRCATPAPRRAPSILAAAAAAARRAGREPRRVEDGTIVGPGNLRTSYWELADDGLARRATPRAGVAPKPAAARRLAGTAAARLDIPDKVFGRPRFIHDLRLPGMLHGRVLRPPSPRRAARRRSTTRPRAGVPGVVAVVRDGSFLGVVAETEDAADAGARAAARAARPGGQGEALPDEAQLARLAQEPAGRDHGRRRARGRRAGARGAHAAARLHAAVHRPCLDRALLRHRAVDATAGVQVWIAQPGRLQSARRPRARAGAAAGAHRRRARRGRRLLRPQRRRRRRARRRAARPRRAGRPGARAVVARGRAGLGALRRRAWRSRSRPISTRAARSSAGATTSGATATSRARAATRSRRCSPPSELAKPFPRFIADRTRRSRPAAAPTATPCRSTTSRPGEITSHRLLAMPLRTSSLRSLGAFANVFAIESFIDELAAERGEDPLAFRLRHLQRPARPGRARGGGRARRLERVAASARASGTASALPATRTPAPIAPSSPRSRARPTSACAGWSSRSTSAR